MSNPDFVVSQPKESTKLSKKELEEKKRQEQLFILGRKIASKFSIRAFAVYQTKSSNKVFVLSGSHFLLLKLNDTKTVSLFKWSSLEKFVIPEKKNEIQMKFRPEKKLALAEGFIVRTDKLEFNISFDSEKFDNIASEIIDTLQRVLTDAELKELSFSALNPPAVTTTAKSALCRFKMSSQGKPSRFSQKTIQQMGRIIQVGTPHVDLSKFEDILIFLKAFIDCVPFIHTLRSIEIPQVPKIDPFPLIIKLLRQPSTLKSIELQGKYNYKDLSKLVDTIRNNASLKLRGIEFGLSSFTSRELNIISDLLTHSNINTLGFHDVFQSEKDANYFCNSILIPSVTQNLYCLNLSQTPNINIEKLFPKISKVRFLSLANCGLEIIDVISKLSLIAMSRLKSIDLSGNRVSAEKYLEENITLPQYLTSFILNNLSWPIDSFRLFLYQIFKHIPKNLKLSLSNSIMDDNEWYKVFDSLENPNENGGFYGLSVLVWDYNPLHKKFFSFLKRNKRLTRLQMNYCFRSGADQSGVLDKLNEYLSSARNLKTLIIRGNDENNFSDNTPRLIEALKSIPNLEQLDILNSHGGNGSLKSIEELCNKNKSLKINFDGLFPTDFEQYKETYSNLVSIRPPPSANSVDDNTNPVFVDQPSLLRISFPFNDMYHLINLKVIKETDVRHFENQFFYSPDEEAERIKKAEKKNQDSKGLRFKPIYTGQLSQPGNLYEFNADEGFPRYIDEDVVEQFKKDIQVISLDGRPDDDDGNIIDEAFQSMILSSRKFSRSSQVSPDKENNGFSPQPSPLSTRQRSIIRKVSEDDEDNENSDLINSDIENSNSQNSDESSDNKITEDEEEVDESGSDVKTPKDARVNDDRNSLLSEDESEEGSEKQSDHQQNDSGSDDENDEEQTEFDIPQLVDIKKYNYSGWKKIDSDFTLQNLYSRMTHTKENSEYISTRNSSKSKSKK